MTGNKWYMVNVVWYDGQSAYVSKFIMPCEDVLHDNGEITTELTFQGRNKVIDYLNGNGEILKFDMLYSLEFDNIVALAGYEHSNLESEIELYAAYDRFKYLYF